MYPHEDSPDWDREQTDGHQQSGAEPGVGSPSLSLFITLLFRIPPVDVRLGDDLVLHEDGRGNRITREHGGDHRNDVIAIVFGEECDTRVAHAVSDKRLPELVDAHGDDDFVVRVPAARPLHGGDAAHHDRLVEGCHGNIHGFGVSCQDVIHSRLGLICTAWRLWSPGRKLCCRS